MSEHNISRAAVFISHASQDDDLVSRIHDRLVATGIDAWADHKDRIGPGADWDSQIQQALNTYAVGLAVLSRNSIKSQPCRSEWWTFQQFKKPLYVALIESLLPEEFPWWLRTIQYIDLGTDFDGGLVRLIEAIQSGAPESEIPAPAHTLITGTIDRRLTQIPISGRDTDLAHIKTLLRRGPTSILGVGGVGKSRLAAEIVLTAEDIGGAIWHVCTDFSRAEDVLIQLREHFGLELTASRHDTLAPLRTQKRLVVFDNAESVSDDRHPDYVALINELFDAGARVLLTSRVEWTEFQPRKVYAPQPLELDPARQVVLDMAVAWELDHDLTPHADTIAEAAKRHPGLIRWAVGLMIHFSPEKVIHDLHELRSKAAQDALDEMIRKTLRQMTEAAGSEPEAALRRLAVCRGGFSYEAALAILGLKNDADRLDECLITLQTWQFVAKTVPPDRRTRFGVDPMALAAVRKDDSAHRPHYDYYHALARLHDKRQDYLGLDVESGNLEAAFEWAMAAEDGKAALFLANACGDFLANRGRFDLRLNWVERVAAVLADHPNRDLWSNAQNSLGATYKDHPTGDRRENLQRAIAAFDEVLRYYRPETDPLSYALIQRNLGTAYRTLSEVENRAENLKRAVAALEEALKYRTPEVAPLEYAATQIDLGLAYWTLSEPEDEVENLKRAVAAFDEALKYQTSDIAPLNYATTQNNLGIAYTKLSNTEDRGENLKRAVAAFDEALKYWTPETAPLNYATTQINLGTAYLTLSEVENRTENLKRAVAALEEALKFYQPETAPLSYATTQNNLGTAYRILSEVENRAENLKRAVAALEEALKYWTPETAPLDHTMTLNNLGNAYADLAGVEDQILNLRRAATAYETALRYLIPDLAPLYYAGTQHNLGTIYGDLAKVENRVINLKQAVAAFEEALKYEQPETVPLDYAQTQNNLGAAYVRLAEVENRAGNLKRAIVAFEEALKYWTPETAPLDYARTQHGYGIVQEQLGNLAAAVACWREAERCYRLMDAAEDADKVRRRIGEAEGRIGK